MNRRDFVIKSRSLSTYIRNDFITKHFSIHENTSGQWKKTFFHMLAVSQKRLLRTETDLNEVGFSSCHHSYFKHWTNLLNYAYSGCWLLQKRHHKYSTLTQILSTVIVKNLLRSRIPITLFFYIRILMLFFFWNFKLILRKNPWLKKQWVFVCWKFVNIIHFVVLN